MTGRSHGAAVLLSAATLATVAVPAAMLVQLVVAVGADRDSTVWGLLHVHLSRAPDVGVDLAADGVRTGLLWLAVFAATTVVGSAVLRRRRAGQR